MTNSTKLLQTLLDDATEALGASAADLLLVAIVSDDPVLASDARILSEAVERELETLRAAGCRWRRTL